MKTLRLIAALGLGGMVAACGAAPDVSTTSVALGAGDPALAFQQEAVMPSMDVTGINVRVPQSLTVSEANGYYPRADIVWRGDGLGDRRQQVKTIFEEAFTSGTSTMNGDRPVIVDVQVKRFHSLTERARERVGGVHNMEFFLTVYDAQTGDVVLPARFVEANLPALGGVAAIEAVQRGQTQRVRVTTYLSLVIQDELGKGPV